MDWLPGCWLGPAGALLLSLVALCGRRWHPKPPEEAKAGAATPGLRAPRPKLTPLKTRKKLRRLDQPNLASARARLRSPNLSTRSRSSRQSGRLSGRTQLSNGSKAHAISSDKWDKEQLAAARAPKPRLKPFDFKAVPIPSEASESGSGSGSGSASDSGATGTPKVELDVGAVVPADPEDAKIATIFYPVPAPGPIDPNVYIPPTDHYFAANNSYKLPLPPPPGPPPTIAGPPPPLGPVDPNIFIPPAGAYFVANNSYKLPPNQARVPSPPALTPPVPVLNPRLPAKGSRTPDAALARCPSEYLFNRARA